MEVISRSDVKNALKKVNNSEYNVIVTPVKAKVQDYIMVFQKAMALLREKQLSATGFMILCYFYEKAGYGNTVPIRAETIVKDCKMNRNTVFKGIKELKTIEVILVAKDMNDTRINTYFINPVYAWKGSVRERSKRIKAIADRNQLSLPGFTENTNFDKEGE
jgi:hypothetical protein